MYQSINQHFFFTPSLTMRRSYILLCDNHYPAVCLQPDADLRSQNLPAIKLILSQHATYLSLSEL